MELPCCTVYWGTFVPQPYSVENKKSVMLRLRMHFVNHMQMLHV